LLEPDSVWPNQAFAAHADCDRVVVVHVDPTEQPRRLVDRIRVHSSEFERFGAKLRTVILSCAGNDPASCDRRAELVGALLTLIEPERGKIVLESDPREGLTTKDLIASVGQSLDNLGGRSIAFLANDEGSTRESTRRGSGTYSIERDIPHDADRYRSAGDEHRERRASEVR
jgi:hypothetical protein